ncbi:Sec14p-like phosphatidylinositol transfer family protein [Thalictrum thalictroides]|uniref:Sec14p-like phosphatidylinositol transfer family protein n=1 Tax=Thalictrum thalictroides TaxID=46969 RepID=A0A7J6UZJ0_THATH|nr:Sec14p-like phosphatidylinositol transfer family protein [Thalictrum thalictroides]
MDCSSSSNEISMESYNTGQNMQQKLDLMRSSVEKQDPTSKEVDDVVLKRFLRHRKLDVEKASDSFLKYLTWRNTFVPNGSISESEIQNQISHKKFFLQGFDKKGRPLVVVFQGRDVPTNGKKSLDELQRYLVYTLDKICARMSCGQEQFSAIVDLKGWGFSKLDLNASPSMLSILQVYLRPSSDSNDATEHAISLFQQ